MTLNNSGNLVFHDFGEHVNLWESFNNQTDTLLPGMDVNSKTTLTSWRGSDDPGERSFMFYLGLDVYKRRFRPKWPNTTIFGNF